MSASLDHLYWYRASVLEVTDGDTVRVLLDHGDNTFRKRYLRFNGLNTPESAGEGKEERGLEAKAFVAKLLPVGTELLVHTIRTSKKRLYDKSEKYGRLLADVYIVDLEAWTVAEVSISQQLIDAKLALPYDGKGKKPV